ncbi:hypothetical protein OSB04_011760 [Centaurea solstitialis]|uniref:Uncharacterized protein n=1 Tax=Centaurea solstitialis TaxID=347529 RepID=A0AA38TN58_9ASTR|nr:hypothetical protein OSB04_011760 [Centaurea solstitialis]
MANVKCKLKWLKGLLLDLVNLPYTSPTTRSFTSIQNTLKWKCHFVRDAIQDGMIGPSFVTTDTQLIDIFSKALGKAQFDTLLDKLGIINPMLHLKGGSKNFLNNMNILYLVPMSSDLDQDQETNEIVLQSTDPDHRSEDLLKTSKSYSKNHQRSQRIS